jgi:hypothetical protein
LPQVLRLPRGGQLGRLQHPLQGVLPAPGTHNIHSPLHLEGVKCFPCNGGLSFDVA